MLLSVINIVSLVLFLSGFSQNGNTYVIRRREFQQQELTCFNPPPRLNKHGAATSANDNTEQAASDDLNGTSNDEEDAASNVRRIAGGRTANRKLWPFYVRILKANSSQSPDNVHECGGIILGERFVLTAAHCFPEVAKSLVGTFKESHRKKKPNFHEHVVQVGVQDLQLYNVEAIILHSGWLRTENARFSKNGDSIFCTMFGDDIAIVRLAEKITQFGTNINQIVPCLPDSQNEPDDVYAHCDLAGTGMTGTSMTSSQSKLQDPLKKVHLDVLPFETCFAEFNKNDNELLRRTFFTGKAVCVKHAKIGNGGCQGDSGGPLMCRSKKTQRLELVGIVSAGISSDPCGENSKPDIMTSIAAYRDWIDQVMREFGPEKIETVTKKYDIWPASLEEMATILQQEPSCEL